MEQSIHLTIIGAIMLSQYHWITLVVLFEGQKHDDIRFQYLKDLIRNDNHANYI